MKMLKKRAEVIKVVVEENDLLWVKGFKAGAGAGSEGGGEFIRYLSGGMDDWGNLFELPEFDLTSVADRQRMAWGLKLRLIYLSISGRSSGEGPVFEQTGDEFLCRVSRKILILTLS